ncbi:MAG: alpha/beta hydrolase [Microbacteriaceae bacterium]
MNAVHPLTVAARFAAQNSQRSRGELLVLPGRGENAGLYERLGARIAYDGYTVTVVELPAPALVDAAWLEAAAAPAGTGEFGPLTLLGADSGALIAALLAERLGASGVVLAGLGGLATAAVSDGDARLDERSACQVHRRRLADTGADLAATSVQRFGPEVAERLATTRLEVATLLLHGTADRITPADEAIAIGRRLHSEPETVLVHGGLHDILNDVSHRSTSAEIVQFLERRAGAVLQRGAVALAPAA